MLLQVSKLLKSQGEVHCPLKMMKGEIESPCLRSSEERILPPGLSLIKTKTLVKYSPSPIQSCESPSQDRTFFGIGFSNLNNGAFEFISLNPSLGTKAAFKFAYILQRQVEI